MSVVGEYRRIHGDLVALLARSALPDAKPFASQLGEVDLERWDSVSDAATRAIEVCENAPASVTSGATGAQLEHFVAICRVVLGR